MSRIPSDLYLI